MTEEDNTADVVIDLTLEEWGRIALIAHGRNETINQTVVFLLQTYIDRELGVTRI